MFIIDLASEATLRREIAFPRTDGDEHCSSFDGCLNK